MIELILAIVGALTLAYFLFVFIVACLALAWLVSNQW